MKRISVTRSLATTALLAAALVSPTAANAELLMDECFDYPVGNLYTSPVQGGWLNTVASSSAYIQVTNTPLTYPGYQDSANGKAMAMADGGYQSLAKSFLDTPATAGKYYVSFLMKVTKAPAEKYQIFAFAGKNFNGWVDTKAAATVFGKLFLAPGTNGGYYLGYSKSGSVATSTYDTTELALGGTYLVVMSYEFVDGNNNDVFSFWVNPATDTTEPQALYESASGSDFGTNGMQGVRFYMGKSTGAGADVTVDALRAATSWADLFGDNGGGGSEIDPPAGDAAITATPTSISCAPEGYMFVGQKASYKVNVSAENLAGPISVVTSMPGLTASASSISASEAEAGYELTFTYTAPAEPENGTATLSSEGASDVVISFAAPAMVAEATNCLNTLAMKNVDDYSYVCYTGTMGRVTYVDAPNKALYFEDMAGAVKITYQTEECPLREGDKVRNLYLMKEEDEACFLALTAAIGEISATESYKTPSEVNFADIRSDLSSYLYRLVTVSDVTFLNVPQNAVWGTANVEAKDEYGTGRVRAFSGTDLAAVAVPLMATSVTGISTSKAMPIITMRSAADFAQPAPEMTVTPELLVNASEYQIVGERVEYGKFKVSTTNMPAITVWLSGTGAKHFSLSAEEIAAGTGTTEITVWYAPTTIGEHKANITFESGITEQNTSFAMTARAYDPANPPVITVDTSALQPFRAAVGETQVQTFSYTAKGLLAYGKAAVEAPASGQFVLSSSMLMKDGTYNMTITFRPQAEGTFTDKIVLTADKAETVEFTVTGTTTGGLTPDQPQGDELEYNTANPYSQYSTDFATATANNQPLSLAGWRNCATVGTRAWWSYELDGNKAAKATLYDSKAEDGEFAQMFLLSPALDYKDADEHLLCFDIMGQYMADGQDGVFNVVYVDPSDPDDIYIEAIGGLAIPSTSDENGEWAHYVIDTKAWNLPDVFFIGFLYQGTRGRDNSAVYYVDNFSWGRTDVPFIRTSHQTLAFEASVGIAHTSESVTVTGLNLTEPITLALSGEHAKSFELSTAELPAEGGTFNLSFLSDEEADHNAWITLRSGSDAQSIIGVTATNKATTGVGSVLPGVSANSTVSVYDISGRVVMTDVKASDAVKAMQAQRGSLFIVRGADGKAVRYMAK